MNSTENPQFASCRKKGVLKSQLTYRSNQSTLTDTVESAFASSTSWISLPCLTTTKAKFSGTGLFGVLVTAVPVQFGFTVWVPLPGVQPASSGTPLTTVCSNV